MDRLLPTGKLPPGMLARLLGEYASKGEGVVVGPGVGEDAAVIDVGAGEYIVAKTDPVTLVSGDAGRYAVAVNANDIACMGAAPRWFLACVILPGGKATERLAEDTFRDISDACKRLGVSLAGGHTEITHGLDRPIVVGQMLGTVKKDRLVTTAGAEPGDAIILTGGIAIEAVSVIARERHDELAGRYDEAFIERCRGFVDDPGISVVKAARAAAGAGKVHCMHDPTEGGLSSGLYEVARAAGVGVEVDAAAIKVLPEAFELLGRFGLDPLGAIASGALVITAPGPDSEKIIAALGGEGIQAWEIGRVTDKSGGVKLLRDGNALDLPVFERDEITKIF